MFPRRQNKFYLPISSNLKSPPPPFALNAWCCLLEHQYMFSPFVIVMHNISPSIVLSVKRWISKSYGQCWKGFKYAEDAGKPKNVQELEDFLTAQDKQGTHEQLSQNIKTVVNHPGNDT